MTLTKHPHVGTEPAVSLPAAGGGALVHASSAQADGLEVVTVDVDGMRCALPARDVAEVHAVVAATALPGAPEPVEGVIDYRGTIVAVVDLRSRLGLPRRPPLLTDHLVMTRVGERVVALRVDRAVDLTTVAVRDLDAADVLAAAPNVRGVAALPDGLVLVHDPESFLSPEETAVLDRAVADLGDGASQGP